MMMVLLQALFKNSDLLGKQVLLQVMNRTNPTPGSQDGVPEVRGAPVTSTHLGTKHHPIDCDPWLRSFEIGPWPQTPWPHDLPQHASVCKMMGWRPRSPTLKYHSLDLPLSCGFWSRKDLDCTALQVHRRVLLLSCITSIPSF